MRFGGGGNPIKPAASASPISISQTRAAGVCIGWGLRLLLAVNLIRAGPVRQRDERNIAHREEPDRLLGGPCGGWFGLAAQSGGGTVAAYCPALLAHWIRNAGSA